MWVCIARWNRMGIGNIYIVTECDPVINKLDELVEQLRQDNDPFLFMKRMRNAFCEYALNNN